MCEKVVVGLDGALFERLTVGYLFLSGICLSGPWALGAETDEVGIARLAVFLAGLAVEVALDLHANRVEGVLFFVEKAYECALLAVGQQRAVEYVV